nr:immunoglobulin heavy chain junction region [Macaca mulatta]
CARERFESAATTDFSGLDAW